LAIARPGRQVREKMEMPARRATPIKLTQNMAKNIATIGGLLIIALAVAALIATRFFPTHYTAPLAMLHLFTGAMALFVGLNAMPASARTFCTFFGGFYCLLAVVVFILNSGDRGILPLQLDVRTLTGLVHLWIGAVFLAAPVIENRRTA